MKHMPTACCVLAGLAIAVSGAAAAQDARSGQPLRSIEQSKAMGQSMAHRNRGVKQPRTEAEALPTLVRRPGGQESMQVPTELWNTLSVRHDAQGAPHQVESAGDAVPPATKAEESCND
jgi:hypothetical protein